MTKLAIKEMIRFMAALALSGCHASITPNVKAGAPLPASAAFHVNALSKVVVTPGEVIKVVGQKFGANLSLRVPENANLTSSAPQAVAGKVTVVSDTEATVALPPSINFGLFTLTLLQDGVEQNVTLLSNGGKTDYPVMVTVPDKMCSGEKFYDESGTLRTGTKDCAASSLPPCSKDGEVECKATKDFVAADARKSLPNNIATGVTIAGVAGTAVVESHASCTTDGASGCVATSTFPAAKLSTFSSSDIRTGNTVAGVAGALANCAADGATNCIAVSTFKAADMGVAIAGNIVSGATIASVPGSAIAGSACSSDGQQNCSVSGVFKAANVTGISTWDLRAGLSLGGITGALKTNCRNAVSTAFNYNGDVSSLPNTAVAAGGAYDYWDTVDDFAGFATNMVTAWSSNTYCDSSTWTDVTTTDGGSTLSTCASSAAACQYKDNITNLVTTKVVSTPSNWSVAVNACASSTYGGYAAGTWRLPTQKELMSQYEHGIVSVVSANFMSLANMQAHYFWSSSTNSTSTTYAWNVLLAYGVTDYGTKTNTNYVSCVK